MIILPAIDIKDGNCVRLLKGDFDTVHKVAEDPFDTAMGFFNCGATWVHMVDLDGAKDKQPRNSEIFLNVAKNSGLLCEVGGGIRSMETIEFYINNGVQRVILGSAALSNPTLVRMACDNYGDHIAVGIDARNHKVAVQGWTETSDQNYITLAKTVEQAGVKCIIYTDISKDGTLLGPNLDDLFEINNAVSCDIIASGGIKDMKDIKALCDIGVYGAICGKSIYSGTLNLVEALAYCEE